MLDILYEDNHCLAVNKPAGLLTQGDATGDPSLIEYARAYLKEKYGKPGNVFVGLVHRLDRPVSGVVLLAKTSKAAGRLSEQFRAGTVEKVYWAWVEGDCPDDSGEWADTLRKDEARNVVEVVPAGTAGGREARLAFRVLRRRGPEQPARTPADDRPQPPAPRPARVARAADRRATGSTGRGRG